MSLLTDLINTCSEEEAKLLNSGPYLSGKEKLVFEFILHNKSDPGISKQEAMIKFGLSSTHFDKINNVLLRKCYKILGGEGVELLHYLNQKLLIKNLLHEVKLIDRRPGGKESGASIKLLFDMVAGVPAKYFNYKQACNYGDRLIAISKNEIGTKIYVECRILYAQLNIVRHGKPSTDKLKKFQAKIAALQNIKNSIHIDPEIKLWIYKTLAFFFIRINRDPQLHIHYLKKIKLVYEENFLLPLKEKAINDCNIASYYYDTNEIGKAQTCYTEAFSKYSHLLSSELRHTSRYIEICILLEDYKRGEMIYRKWMRPVLITEHEVFGVLAALTYAKYLIHTGKYNTAIKILQKGKLLNSRMVYYKYDIELRMLENLIFTLRKDYDFAMELALKNLKYISSQGLSIKKFMHARFFRLLINVIYNLKEGVPFSPQTVRYYKEYQQGELLIYGLLIKKIKNKGRLN
jgi:hypothetical protein